MSSSQLGQATSEIAVTDISPDGLWVLVDDEELFLTFAEFPWFKRSTIEQILNVQVEGVDAFHWPDLGVDLSLESMRHPERYPNRAPAAHLTK